MASEATDGSSSFSLGGAPQAVVGGRLGRLDLQQHVGALVLDRLERADRATELDAHLGVLDGHVEDLLRAADLLGGEADDDQVERLVEHVHTVALGADERARHVLENSSLACLRVWSIVDSDVRVRPGASPSTANRLVAPSTLAATMIRLARWPSITKLLVPLSL